VALTSPIAARLGTRLGWLAALSFASGLPYFFFNETVPVWLAASGMSLAGIGLASGASLPWVLKFLWAPLVDRLGSRRLWIRCCLALLAATTAWIAGADPARHAGQLAALLLFYVTLSATQDIATDGLAVEMLGADERGFANGIQVAGYRVGMIVVHVFDDAGLGLDQFFIQRVGDCQRCLVEPVDRAKAADQMAALDPHAIKREVLKAGVARGVGMARQIARAQTRQSAIVGRFLGTTQQGQARPGQRLFEAGSAVDQQGYAIVAGNGLAVLGQGRDQQDRRQVVIDRQQHQGDVGPASVALGEGDAQRGAIGAAQQLARQDVGLLLAHAACRLRASSAPNKMPVSRNGGRVVSSTIQAKCRRKSGGAVPSGAPTGAPISCGATISATPAKAQYSRVLPRGSSIIARPPAVHKAVAIHHTCLPASSPVSTPGGTGCKPMAGASTTAR